MDMDEDPIIAVFKLGTKAHMTEFLQERTATLGSQRSP